MRSRTSSLIVPVVMACALQPWMAAAEEVSRAFDVAPGQLLSLSLDRVGGRLEIEGWEQNRVEITGSIRGARDLGGLEFDQSRDGIEVARRGRFDDDVEVRLSIKVPRQFDLRLEASTQTRIRGVHGDIEVSVGNENLELEDVHGEARIGAANGRLTLTNCSLTGKVSNVNGRLRIEDSAVAGEVTVVNANMWVSRAPQGIEVSSTNGSIEVERAADEVLARSTNGHVKIQALEGWIEAETVNGSVSVAMTGDPQGNRTVDIETLNGRVDLEIPSDFSMAFDIEVRSEDEDRRDYEIVSDFDIDIQTQDGRRVYQLRGKGSLGDGRNRVRIRATNGDVVLRRAPTAP